MAFKQDVGDPKVDVADAVSSKVGTASRLQALEGIVQVAGGVAGDIMQQQQESGRQQVFTDSIFKLQDLEAERSGLMEREQKLQRQLEPLYKDLQVTEEEQKVIEGLQEEIDFLNQARETGVLNQRQFNTRFNTLMREQMAEASNVGIAGEIHKLFTASRSSTFAQPEPSEQEKQVTAFMDSLYPDGWTQQQMAMEIGKAQKARGILSNPSMSPVEAAEATRTSISNTFRAITSSGSDVQGVITPQEMQLLGDQALQTGQQMRATVMSNISTLRSLGRYDKAAQDRAKATLEAIDKEVNFYTKDIFDTPAFKNRGLRAATEEAVAIMENLDKLGVPPQVRMLSKVMGGPGAGGGAVGATVGDMLNWDERVWSELASNDPMGRDGATLKNATVGAIMSALNSGKAISDIPGMNPGIVALFSSEQRKKPTPAEKTERTEYLDTAFYGAQPVANDPSFNRDLALNAAKDVDKLYAEANKGGWTGELKGRYTSNIRRMHEEALKYAEDHNIPLPVMNQDGSIDASGVNALIGTLQADKGDAVIQRNARKLMGMLEGIDKYQRTVFAKDGLTKPEDVLSVYTKGSEAVKGVVGTEITQEEVVAEPPSTELPEGVDPSDGLSQEEMAILEKFMSDLAPRDRLEVLRKAGFRPE